MKYKQHRCEGHEFKIYRKYALSLPTSRSSDIYVGTQWILSRKYTSNFSWISTRYSQVKKGVKIVFGHSTIRSTEHFKI